MSWCCIRAEAIVEKIKFKKSTPVDLTIPKVNQVVYCTRHASLNKTSLEAKIGLFYFKGEERVSF